MSEHNHPTYRHHAWKDCPGCNTVPTEHDWSISHADGAWSLDCALCAWQSARADEARRAFDTPRSEALMPECGYECPFSEVAHLNGTTDHPFERAARAAIGVADTSGLRALWDEPHHLGFPVSGRTGTYDSDTVLVRRDWYDRLAALALSGATPEDWSKRPSCALCGHTYTGHLLGVACCDCPGYSSGTAPEATAPGLDVERLRLAIEAYYRKKPGTMAYAARHIAAEYRRLTDQQGSKP